MPFFRKQGEAGKNPRLAAVEDCTRRAVEQLGAHNIPVAFEINHGGHFQYIPARIVRGISSLMTL